MFTSLTSPLKIRGLTLDNRAVMTGMGTQFPDEESRATDQLVNYHRARAKGGMGLNTIEVTSVYHKSNPPKFLSISDDSYIDSIKRVVEAIHEENGKAGIQLWQAGLNAGSVPTVPLYSPSDVEMPGGEKVEALSVAEINEIVIDFGKAAKRVVTAGVDMIEIHAGHNYLIHTFLSSAFNKRDDEYGGSLENRWRFLKEIIIEIRKNIPEDMPVFMRINAFDDYLEDGLTIEDMISVGKMAKENGVDVLNVSRGNTSTELGLALEVPPIDYEEGFNIENAAKIKEETGLIVMGVGRVHDPKLANSIIESGKVDLVAMSRASLADPNFMKKVKAGEEKDIVRCTGCNQGCFDGFINPNAEHISCLFNPAVGREEELKMTTAKTPKDVMVIGGGPAGIQAAMTLDKRGHRVSLYEKEDRLGGRFHLAGKGPHKSEFKEALDLMIDRVERSEVTVELQAEVTEALIKEKAPEVIISAIGGTDKKLEGQTDILYAEDVLAKDFTIDKEAGTAIIGGRMIALEVAEHLHEQGVDVTILTEEEGLGSDMGAIRMPVVTNRLKEKGVKSLVGLTDIKVDNKTVSYNNGKDTKTFDTIIYCNGTVAKDTEKLRKISENASIEFHVVSEELISDLVLEPIKEATEIAMKI